MLYLVIVERRNYDASKKKKENHCGRAYKFYVSE
jgi:hypothetical protein